MAQKIHEDAEPLLPSQTGVETSTPEPPYFVVSKHAIRKYFWTMTAALLTGIAISSVLWLTAWNFLSGTNSGIISSAAVETTCGSSYASAIANNCIFQLWSFSWVPPECFDNELHDEFLSLRAKEGWHYYSSLSPLIKVPLDSVLAGNRNDLHSTWGQHFWHCAFYQRKFFRMVEEHDDRREATLKMTRRDLGEEHARHCQKWLAHPEMYAWDDVRVNLTVGYDICL